MEASPSDGLLGAALVVVLTATLVAAPLIAGAQPAGDSTLALAGGQSAVDADAVLLSVELQSDGDAHWRIEYRVRLDDENATAAFEELQADVDANESAYVQRFADRLSRTVQDAEAATGREMALRNVSVAATTQQLPQTYGVLAYSFEWTGFAAVDGGELRAGDALAGLFLDADSSLVMSWPSSHRLGAVEPTPAEERERSVIWRGPTEFGADEPHVVLTTSTVGQPSSALGLAVVLAVLIGGGGLWWWRRRASDRDTTEPTPAADEAARPTTEGSEPPDELLSNEERVLALLESHGGRMKQQTIVEELGWTDAKTSQVVGKLREEGQIEGFRLGRENVLRLPDVDQVPGGDSADEA